MGVGPFTDAPAGGAMGVFAARDAAERFVKADPFVAHGVVAHWTIREWNEVLTPRNAVQITPYLYFKGTCESALRFYEACGLGKIRELRRYEGTPMAERDGDVWREKVLHSVFEGPGLRLCASDGPDSEPMKGCAVLIEDDSPERAQTLFEALSVDGRVTVRFKKQFGGDHYGNFTDKFGVQWAINSHPNV